jgi:hypothetical protein
MSYQAVLRNSSSVNHIRASGYEISILQSSATGTVAYSEENPKTKTQWPGKFRNR